MPSLTEFKQSADRPPFDVARRASGVPTAGEACCGDMGRGGAAEETHLLNASHLQDGAAAETPELESGEGRRGLQRQSHSDASAKLAAEAGPSRKTLGGGRLTALLGGLGFGWRRQGVAAGETQQAEQRVVGGGYELSLCVSPERTPSPPGGTAEASTAAAEGEAGTGTNTANTCGCCGGGKDAALYSKWAVCGVEPLPVEHPRENARLCRVVFFLFFLLSIAVNFDCGAIPCTLALMAEEFRLSPTWQGTLGALPYVGLTIAAPFAGGLYFRHPPKRVVLVFTALNAAATLLMVATIVFPAARDDFSEEALTSSAPPPSAETPPASPSSQAPAAPSFLQQLDFSFQDLTPPAALLLASRFLVGFTQAPLVVYAPVWVDEFAPPRKAALWMGVTQGAAVVGVTVGYLCAGLLSIELKLNWRAAIVLQILGLLALCGAFLYVPAEALDASHKNSPSASAAVLAEEASSSSSEAGEATPHSGGGEGEAAGQGSFVERRKERPSLETERHLWREEPPSSPPRALQPAQARRRSWGRAFLVLFRTPLYILPALTLCALLFVVTGVQFWGTFFLTASLGLSPQTAMFAFAGVAASAPTLGVLGGGFFVDFLGGYKTPEAKKRTLVATTANAALAVIFGLSGGFSHEPRTMIACLWFLLFFGGAMLPPLTGVQIDAVSASMRTDASGLSMFLYNTLGYALGTFLPGVAMDIFQGGEVLGLRLVLCWSLFGLAFSAASAIYACWKLPLDSARSRPLRPVGRTALEQQTCPPTQEGGGSRGTSLLVSASETRRGSSFSGDADSCVVGEAAADPL